MAYGHGYRKSYGRGRSSLFRGKGKRVAGGSSQGPAGRSGVYRARVAPDTPRFVPAAAHPKLEVHYCDQSWSFPTDFVSVSTIAPAAAPYGISLAPMLFFDQISSGSSITQRIGAAIKCLNIHIRGTLRIKTPGGTGMDLTPATRFIVVRDKMCAPSASAVLPKYSDVFGSPGTAIINAYDVNSFQLPDNQDRFELLFDKRYSLNSVNRPEIQLDEKIILNKVLQYDSSPDATPLNSIGDMIYGALYGFWMAESGGAATSGCNVTAYARCTFVDWS